ncbi:unnamed protein product [Phytophthora fragariaefolia]|uniref:Unnamed protein product n=1 Tax=Phytophthora fragariaefolia TaxID=1490495 RepID=A0A9W7CZ56_9STRA|nr:unnamed protein product [Phytophthora fragariaefolia]
MEGFVITWRSRLVGRGVFQQFGADYNVTFSPVARMLTFRVVIAIATKMHLILYEGDIDTAYLNANPKIKQYLHRVNNALYGLHQSGAKCTKDDVLALIPLYVDDVVLATNSVDYKTSLFADFNKKYGFKDEGLVHNFLGVQVEQNEDCIRIHQEKYCKEVLERFGFDGAHGSGTPMETNAKFVPNDQ